MGGHRADGGAGVAGEQRGDDCQVLSGFHTDPVEVAAGLFQIPGHVAERLVERPQAGQFGSEEAVPAARADQVVQGVIEFAGLGHRVRSGRGRGQRADVGRDRLHLRPVGPLRGPAHRLALQHLPHLKHFAHVAGGHLPHDGPAVRQQVYHTATAEFDERLTDWSVTDAEAVRKCLRDEPLPGAELPVEDVRKDGAHDGLPAQAVVERGVGRRLEFGHGLRHEREARRASLEVNVVYPARTRQAI